MLVSKKEKYNEESIKRPNSYIFDNIIQMFIHIQSIIDKIVGCFTAVLDLILYWETKDRQPIKHVC